MRPSASPVSSLCSLVSTLPRTPATRSRGRSSRSWAARRALPVAMTASSGRSAGLTPGRSTRASRGSSRFQKRERRRPGRQFARQILEAVHREIDRAFEQGALNLPGKHAHGAELGERPVLHRVPPCADGDELARAAVFPQAARHGLRLREGELGPPRSQPDGHDSSPSQP